MQLLHGPIRYLIAIVYAPNKTISKLFRDFDLCSEDPDVDAKVRRPIYISRKDIIERHHAQARKREENMTKENHLLAARLSGKTLTSL